MSREMCFAGVEELLSHYASGKWTPLQVTEAMLDRIEALDGQLNAFVFVDREGALEQAKASTQRWKDGEAGGHLDGVPVAVKDVMYMKGFPTAYGSNVLAPDTPNEVDSPCVARLREAGCVLIGKTTTPEIGWKGITDCPHTGITRNPWNTERTPGGSSGGSTAAVAAGMVTLATASDGGGSIRIPAGFSGLCGLKPTFGLVPAWPPSTFGALSHVGGVGRTVEDCAHMMTVISKPDALDPASIPSGGLPFHTLLEGGVSGLKIAYSPTLGGHPVAPDVAASVKSAVDWFADNGAQVHEFEPDMDKVTWAFHVIWTTAAAWRLRDLSEEERAQVDPGLIEISDQGAAHPVTDYHQALAVRNDLRMRMCEVFEDIDLMLTPTLPIGAFEAGYNRPRSGEQGSDWETWTPFTYPFNLTQQPAMTVPCGLTDDGMPIGLQIIGWRGDDALIMQAAHAFDRSRDWTFPEL